MARQRQITENWNVGFTRRDRNTSEDMINLNMSWENGDIEHIRESLNTWLTAIGVPLEVVEKK